MKCKELTQTDLLYKDIESSISSIRAKQRRYNSFYLATKVLIFTAGALITITTGWQLELCETFNHNNLVLVLSTGVALLTSLEGLFHFKDKGKSYDILLFELRRLRDRICFDFTNNLENYHENKRKHFEAYQLILESQRSIIESADEAQG